MTYVIPKSTFDTYEFNWSGQANYWPSIFSFELASAIHKINMLCKNCIMYDN